LGGHPEVNKAGMRAGGRGGDGGLTCLHLHQPMGGG